MSKNITTIIYPVTDVATAKVLYSKFLGVEPYVDMPYYVGFKLAEQEIGLTPGAQGEGPTCYVDVADIASSLQELVGAGAEIEQEAHNVGGGLLIATAKDADGNIIGLRQPPA